MAVVSKALVRFPEEKNKTFVVDVSDIKNFNPKSVKDFDPAKKYDVKWPILKREDSTSSTTADDFPAFIILLAVDAKSLAYSAKASGIKLPSGFRASLSSPISKKRSRSNSKAEPSKSKSKKSKKHVAETQSIEAKKRMKEIVDMHKGGNILPTVADGNTSKVAPVVRNGNGSEIAPVIQDENAGNGKIDTDIEMPSTKVVQAKNLDDEESDSAETVKASPFKLQRQDSFIDSDDSQSISTTSDDQQKFNDLNLQIEDLRTRLASAQRESRRLQTELTSKSIQLLKWRQCFKTFKDMGFGMLNYEDTLNSPSKSPMFRNYVSPRVKNWVAEHQPQSSSSKAVKNLFPDDNHDPAANFEVVEIPSPAKKSPGIRQSLKITPQKSAVKLAEESPEKSCKEYAKESPKQSPKKSPKKDSPKKSIKKKSNQQSSSKKQSKGLGPHEKNNKDLAPMILAALNNECPLQTDGKGNVHIGNNVYIKESAWTENIAPSDMKMSLAIKNLVGAIWTVKEGAALSLEGGVSPKTGACSKEAVPQGKLEAILAIYRAKLMQEGILKETYIEAGIKNSARKYIREKLQENHRTLKREEEKKQDKK